MRRYWLFICPTYYPAGGMDDLKGNFESLEDAVNVGNANEDVPRFASWHIWDSFTLKIIKRDTE